MERLKVNLLGIELDNPIIPASGTFGYGKEFSRLFDLNCLGTFSFKGTTPKARFGNEEPRIAETPSGMLNAVGLQNPGIDHVLAYELPEMKKFFQKKVMANISGFSVEDYVFSAKKLDQEEQVGWLEVNISCPNVHGGGMAFGKEPKAAYEVTSAVKKVTSKPVIMKLSPNVKDITEIAKACEDGGADGLSLINTLLGMRIDLWEKKPILKAKTGGLSGPALFPLALAMVYQVFESVKIPLIGMGGISSCENVIEMMEAGASAVQIGAANLVDPLICPKIIKGLPELMDRLGINQLTDIIGASHEK